MDKPPDYYAILHVPRDATRQQISRAYRALMRSHHPDMDSGRAAAGMPEGLQNGAQKADAVRGTPPPEGELLRIMQAFTVLRDPARREAYDREAEAGPAARAAPAAQAGTNIPVRKIRHPAGSSGTTIRITPVRWESGPWA